MAATDGSSGGLRAVEAAAELAKATGAQLSILTIGGSGGPEIDQLIRAEGNAGEAMELLCNQALTEGQRSARQAGIANVKLLTKWGDAAEVIIESARHENADLIVVGRRGRGRLTGLLLGSVSQKIVSLAPCKVMIVP